MTPKYTNGPEPWRLLTPGEVVLACGAFLAAHPRCDEAVWLTREGDSLVCWCDDCQDLRTYTVSAGETSFPHLNLASVWDTTKGARDRGDMQARVVSLRVPSEKAEELEAAYRNVLLPEMEQYPGFSAMVLLRDADTGELLELTLWQDEEAKRTSEGEWELLKWKLQSLAAVSGQTPTVENYDLWLSS